jgi:hypothetical protein
MIVTTWISSLATLLSKLEEKLGLPSRVAAGAAAVSLTATIACGSDTHPADAQPLEQEVAVPSRPPHTSASRTIRRYGERFILTPADSVVIRTDTAWHPRARQKRRAATGSDNTARIVSPSPPPTIERPPVRLPSIGGSSGGHRSHVSHASHSSHSSHRSGGWI